MEACLLLGYIIEVYSGVKLVENHCLAIVYTATQCVLELKLIKAARGRVWVLSTLAGMNDGVCQSTVKSIPGLTPATSALSRTLSMLTTRKPRFDS